METIQCSVSDVQENSSEVNGNKCQNCGREFKPAQGKRYCGETCRYYYNYKKSLSKSDWRDDRNAAADSMQSGRVRALSMFLAKLQESGQMHG